MIGPNLESINWWPQMPKKAFPIIVIGAGGIVKDAHLPAYKMAGFSIHGIYDLDTTKAQDLAVEFTIDKVYCSLKQAIDDAPVACVYDIALPAVANLKVLKALPDGASVLIQKPMGNDLKTAEEILRICRQKRLKAAVNFQLRYAPFMLAAKDMIDKGWIGDLCDVEFNINVATPWHLWDFLYTVPRVEILYHSIHYLDFIRVLLGNPQRVLAKTTKHPNSPQLASVRSDIILDYGDNIRANIHTNHNHIFGPEHQNAYLKLEGTNGAIKIQLGLLMDYPRGVPDKFEFVMLNEGHRPTWQELPVQGSWFPHAFMGSMAQIMCYTEGTSEKLDNSVEDVIWTMKYVEEAYKY